MLKNKLFISGLVVLFFLTACAKEEVVEKPKEIKAVSVETLELKAEHYNSYLNVVGTVKPVEKALLSYAEGGEVKKILVDKGGMVKKGDVIIEIDNAILKAGRDAAKAQYDLAKLTFEKMEKIYKEKINSEIEFLQSKFNMEQAKANFEQINERYEKTFIKSPINGRVDKRYYDVGEMVLPGSPVVEIINTSSLKIEAGVAESYASDVKKGSSAVVSFPTVAGETFKSTVSFVGSEVSTKNRTFPVEVLIENPGNNIKPEMLAELKILQAEYESVVSVPEEVVLRDADSFIVYVASNGKAIAKHIDILSRYDGKIAVASGLKSGDSLIVLGYQNLIHDENILVVN